MHLLVCFVLVDHLVGHFNAVSKRKIWEKAGRSAKIVLKIQVMEYCLSKVKDSTNYRIAVGRIINVEQYKKILMH